MALSPVILERLLSNRGLKKEQLYLNADQMPSPFEMTDMDKSVDLVKTAINESQFILVVADFDCDGATACATMLRGLVLLGAKQERIAFIVPDRAKHGYGLTPMLVDVISQNGWQPDLLITVDNGISSHEGIDAVRKAYPAIKILVTDHHLQADSLPNADAIINPNRNDCLFPSKNIAGVGVAFFLLLGVKQSMKSAANISSLLNIVAMGTVCDVVPMDALNRTIVRFGLMQIRGHQCIQGIKSLASIAEKQLLDFITSDFGFSLGPRINASGRMSDMSLGINLLLTDDILEADEMAKQLDETNKERQRVERNMISQANTLLANMTLDNVPDVLCLFDERWHQGVIGLLASRLKDRVYRPVFVFAKGSDGDIKASCRSIPGVHIRDLAARVFKKHPEMGNRFGGHAMAMGMTIKEAHFDLFKSAIEAELKTIDKKVFTPERISDGPLHARDLTVENTKSLLFEIPWGKDFEPPVFEGEFNVIDAKMIGKDKNHLQFKTLINGRKFSSIAFGVGMPESLTSGKGRIKCLYCPQINEWQGNISIQLNISEML